MGEPETYHFHFLNYCLWKSQNMEIGNVESVGKDARRKILNIRLWISWTSWRWDQYLPENTKYKFGTMESIYSNKTLNGFLNLWTFESLNLGTREPWNQGTKKQRNQTTQTKKQETTKPTNQKTYPPTPQRTDSHPCTSPPSWGTRGNLGETSGYSANRQKRRYWRWYC